MPPPLLSTTNHTRVLFLTLNRLTALHNEKVQSAITRYSSLLRRILSVLENHLSGLAPGNGEGAPTHTARPWLVGDKMTYADLSFV